MPEQVDIPLADLLIDARNARLREEQPSQQAALLAIAEQQGKRLLHLAKDIVANGLDPTTLPAVVPTEDQKKRYLVIEGNRRVAALKALETPSLIAPAFDTRSQKTLNNLANRFAQNPIESIICVLFQSEDELDHWVRLRHTGANDGVGLVEWGADEKDRYAARHGQRSPAGQILDFVEKAGDLSDAAKQSNKGIITSLTRLINTPRVRELFGIEKLDGEVRSWYPASQVGRILTRVVEDLKTETIKVGDIYHAPDRIGYAERVLEEEPTDRADRLDTPRPLDALDVEAPARRPKRKRRKKRRPERTSLIPQSCHLDIDHPRINSIYNELMTLSVDQYPNACSVALRVFVELSVDHFLEHKGLMSEEDRRNKALAKRLKVAAAELKGKGKISTQLEKAIQKAADSTVVLAASTVNFNQYVHNRHVFPKPTELTIAWDELQPFMEQLWP